MFSLYFFTLIRLVLRSISTESTVYTVKKGYDFPSPAGMSLTRLSLAGNNLSIPGQAEFGTWHPGWVRENRWLFIQYSVKQPSDRGYYEYHEKTNVSRYGSLSQGLKLLQLLFTAEQYGWTSASRPMPPESAFRHLSPLPERSDTGLVPSSVYFIIPGPGWWDAEQSGAPAWKSY